MSWKDFFNHQKNGIMSDALQKEMDGDIGKATLKYVNDALKRIPPRITFPPVIIEYIVIESVVHGIRTENLIKYLNDKYNTNLENTEDIKYTTSLISNIAKVSFMRARCNRIGLEWYEWCAVGGRRGDGRTRKSHRNISGVLINWNDPPSPEALVGEPYIGRYHAGEIEGCRCYTSPIVDSDTLKWPMRIYRNGEIGKITKTEFKKMTKSTTHKANEKERDDHKMCYCAHCRRRVPGKKKVNWIITALATLFSAGAWLVFYIPYYVFFKKKVCPICGRKVYT